MGIKMFSGGLLCETVEPVRPNGEAEGVSGGCFENGRWKFSRVTDTEIIGTTVQDRGTDQGAYLHLYEAEVVGYQASKHGGEGLMGRKITTPDGTVHTVVEIIGGDHITAAQSAVILESFLPQYGNPLVSTDPMRVRVSEDGKSDEGTGWIVDIHGRLTKAGRGQAIIDVWVLCDTGMVFCIQWKVFKRARKNDAGRFATPGEQALEGIFEHGREIVHAFGRMLEDGTMMVRFFHASRIMRAQRDAGIPLEAPEGVVKSKKDKLKGEPLYGKTVRAAGRANGLPYYLRYRRGGHEGSDGVTPRMPLYYSTSAIEKFLATLPAEERAEMDTGWVPFSPSYLPAWIGNCLY